MNKSPTWLLDFKSDTYSQTGEDGIIKKILEIIPQNDKWCVDFGAWDGLYLSNTRNLIETKGYSAILIEFIQSADNSVRQGASLLSLVKLGKDKGYELVSVLKFNAFFVRSKYYPLFKMENNSPIVLRTNLSNITYLFSGYYGKIFLTGGLKLPWHGGIELRESRVQHLPRILQKHPSDYGDIEKIISKVKKN
jgi:hypothetical protein